ncbi:MAG: hypothetical protein EAZ24_06610 [Burkholderiales bacterium]|nr:MAG: hypothetical protein EAZ24_06610 [Burkholderiales bacterium]TAG81407.1 MAG: hypothetical protein EAZ21_06130 [Betaproteobacteria bacterium]
MKLLLDENLSRRLVPPLQEIYPGTTQVEFVGLAGADDVDICEFAAANDSMIVSKDEDYERLVAVRGFSPKLIRLTLGNSSNAAALNALLSNADAIIAALNNPKRGIVQLG